MLLLLKQTQHCYIAQSWHLLCKTQTTEYVCPQRKWHLVAEVEWAGLTQKTIGSERNMGMPTIFRDLAAAEWYYLLSVLSKYIVKAHTSKGSDLEDTSNHLLCSKLGKYFLSASKYA